MQSKISLSGKNQSKCYISNAGKVIAQANEKVAVNEHHLVDESLDYIFHGAKQTKKLGLLM